LKGKLRAKKEPVTAWNHSDIAVREEEVGLKGSPTQVIKIFNPPAKTGGRILKGEPHEIVDELVREIKGVL
jgi:electron transfer flavoprotein beta subunit